MLKAVLNNLPEEWENIQQSSYIDQRYNLFSLTPRDNEYGKVLNPFVNGTKRLFVESLQRVQNPYQLGKFLVRKEQMTSKNEIVDVKTYYHPIHKADLNIALEYNMDIRCYTHSYSGHHDGEKKNPKFFQTPQSAENAVPSDCEKVILICNVLKGRYETSTIIKENNTEYMPVYVASLLNN